QPYIFSNGYQIKFNEDPRPDCNVGYIVPEWVQENPTLADIQGIYGAGKILPTTTIILPLKPEKVMAMKQQLSSMHPEVLLFLSKIKRLRVRKENNDPKCNTVNAISISSETEICRRKSINAESYTLHLSAEENNAGQENRCVYHMWRQRFPVRLENQVERRKEVDEWVITLAFPFGERLDRGMGSPGIYAFLPTEMFTNFPFIIQADFVLASSRETILLDNIWNKGILDCVPFAFFNAFVSLVKETVAPASSIVRNFEFLPVDSSPYKELNTVREAIKAKVTAADIIPCQSYTQQKLFGKPAEVGRLLPAFWDFLIKASKQGVSLQNLSSHGTYVLHSTFDGSEYDRILNFLGVGLISNDWYVKCIRSSNLVGVSEDLYLELLAFLADNWRNFMNTDIKNVPLLAYIDRNSKKSFCSINKATEAYEDRISISSDADQISWLIDWNLEFRFVAARLFIPETTQKALRSYRRKETVSEWLRQYVSVHSISAYDYGVLISNAVGSDRRLVIAFTHFLYHSFKRKYLSDRELNQLCGSLPLVNNYGQVTKERKRVLVPARGSKWVELLGSNPWRRENYVELSEDYFMAGSFAGVYSQEKQLMKFMKSIVQASDIPALHPPDAAFPTVSSRLTKENTFLLLVWIRNLKSKGVNLPHRFVQCIKEGSWLRTSAGYKPPSEAFLSSSDWGSLLQMGSVLVDIPLIDQEFYNYRINHYKEELKTVGVMFEHGEACRYIGDRLMKLAALTRLTKSNVIAMLQLIRFMQEKYFSPAEFIKAVQQGQWLRTSHGDRSPVGSILSCPEWKNASQICSPPFIDEEYYGNEILGYKTELQQLGVVVGFNQDHQIVVDYFSWNASPASLSSNTVVLMLECIRNARSPNQIIAKITNIRWVKTNCGYQLPAESFLFDSKWGCLLNAVNGLPVIDESFYGSRIRSFKDELGRAGVAVTLDRASKEVSRRFKALLQMSAVTKNHVFALDCYRNLKDKKPSFPSDLFNCLLQEKWLKTHIFGYRSPKDSILFNGEWKSISPIAILPFIDDTSYGEKIYEYKDELKDFGTTVSLNEGSKFVAAGLSIQNPDMLTSSNVLSLLKCIRNLMKHCSTIPEELKQRINKKWLRTSMGYQLPSECILFDSNWAHHLECEDGPFIDEAFYGPEISAYKKELNAIGVVVEVEYGCSVLAGHLVCHSSLMVVTRIYEYLRKFNWKPSSKEARWVWIPNESDAGEWVDQKSCVIHDKDNLFSFRLQVLDKYYEKEILAFFTETFGVRSNPTVEDYCSLWQDWENTGHKMTNEDCCSFWTFIAKHWTKKVEGILSSSIAKVPVNTNLGGIKLVGKRDAFIPDDLHLKALFEEASEEPIFVWYPQPSKPGIPRDKLNSIYIGIGVRNISQCIRKEESLAPNSPEFQKVDPKDAMLQNGLFRIVLGFLSDPSSEIPIEKGHQIIKSLIDAVMFESDVTVRYGLPLSSGKVIEAQDEQMIRWDREDSKLFIRKLDRLSCKTSNIKFATNFSDVISNGLLWEEPDQIAGLRELVMIGCLLDFEEEAVEFLLRTKNLQVFKEDEEFLKSALSAR
ncbi:hypothetical protein ACLOJK_018871, partial [Asimina triloba]